MLFKINLLVTLVSFSTLFAQQEHAYHILDVEGKAFYRNIYSPQESLKPLIRGTKLPSSDKFYIDVREIDTKVTVACADLSNPRVINLSYDSTSFNWCGTQSTKPQPRLFLGRYHAKGLEFIEPKVLEPRATKLLVADPTFRWEKVINANSYTVILRDNYGNTACQKNNIVVTQYTCWENLPADTQYYLEVTAWVDGQIYTSKETTEIAFSILSTSERQVVENRELALINTLDSLAKDYALAQLYMYHDLNLNALQRLEPYDTWKNPQSQLLNDFAIHYTLGELYIRTQQPKAAKHSLKKALEIAQFTGDTVNERKANQLLDQLETEVNYESR